MKKLIRILCSFIPVPQWRRKTRNFLLGGGVFLLIPTDKVRLFYFSALPNFGDKLNENLMVFFDCPFLLNSASSADLTCIGSVMHAHLITKKTFSTTKTMKIFGSGFIEPPNNEKEQFNRPMKFYALRGKISRDRCEKITGQDLSKLPLGDPGLLIKKMFPEIHRHQKYDVGIVLHHLEQNCELIKKIQLQMLSYKIIDITSESQAFISQISECGFVLSSALHGLICSDSLGIPNKHIILTDCVIGGKYKFKDYYSVFNNFEYTAVDLNKTFITDSDIALFKIQYTITTEEIDAICDRLIKAFPY